MVRSPASCSDQVYCHLQTRPARASKASKTCKAEGLKDSLADLLQHCAASRGIVAVLVFSILLSRSQRAMEVVARWLSGGL